jgi:hypothetical protein
MDTLMVAPLVMVTLMMLSPFLSYLLALWLNLGGVRSSFTGVGNSVR